MHFCVCWYFALKRQCHKIFALGFFHESSVSKPLKIRLGSFQTFSTNSARGYLQVNVHHWYQRHRWEIWHQCCLHRWKICTASTTPVANMQMRAIRKKVPQIRKFAGLQNLSNLRTFRKCGICGFAVCGPNIFCNLDSKFLCRLKTSANLQIPYFLKYIAKKCSNSNFYLLKNSAKQTCSRLLDSFAVKWGNFLKKMFHSLCFMVENFWICI